jgi:hypothetical protein
MKKNKIYILAALTFGVVLAGCDTGVLSDPEEPSAESVITSYLADQSEGFTSEDPATLRQEITLDNHNWATLLSGIASSYKFVALDLSACLRGTQSSNGGLYADGTFDHFAANSTAKWQIVSLTLPDAAARVPTGTSTNPTFASFINLKALSGAGATTIGKYAFSRNGILASVSLTKAVTIDDYAFQDCAALTDVSLPEAVTIGYGAFQDCEALASVSLPKAVTISGNAFWQCYLLASVSLPEAVTTSQNAFGYCPLTDVSLPKAVTIGNTTFGYCAALVSVSLPEAVNIGNTVFNNCAALTDVSLPKAVNIGNSVFYNCAALTNVSLSKVATIGNTVFYNCEKLESITIGANCTIGTTGQGTRGNLFRTYYNGANKAA